MKKASLLYLGLDQFYVRAAEVVSGNGAPLVVIDRGHVLDADDGARSAGVSEGMSVREARTLLEGARFVAYRPEPYREAAERVRAIALAYVDRLYSPREHEITLDLSLHVDPEEIARRLLAEVRDRTGLRAYAALAPSAWVARVAAREAHALGRELGVGCVERVDQAARWLAERPIEVLAPLSPETRERLRFLGYRRVGEVAATSLDRLRAAFGPEAWAIRLAALGEDREPFEPNVPPEACAARFRFEGGTSDAGVLRAGLGELARKLAERLGATHRRGQHLRVLVAFEDGEVVARERRFVRPLAHASTIRFALETLMREVSCESPVREVRAVMERLEPAHGLQGRLMAGFEPEERRLRAEQAARALRCVLGDQAVLRASERPEPRRQKVLRAWRDAVGWR